MLLYDGVMAEHPTEQDPAVLFAGGEPPIVAPAAEEAAPAGAVRVQWIANLENDVRLARCPFLPPSFARAK